MKKDGNTKKNPFLVSGRFHRCEKNVKIIGKNWKCHETWSVCQRFPLFLRHFTFNGRNIGTINFVNVFLLESGDLFFWFWLRVCWNISCFTWFLAIHWSQKLSKSSITPCHFLEPNVKLISASGFKFLCQKSLQRLFMLAKFYDTRKISIFTFSICRKEKRSSFIAFPFNVMFRKSMTIALTLFYIFQLSGQRKAIYMIRNGNKTKSLLQKRLWLLPFVMGSSYFPRMKRDILWIFYAA